MSDQQREAAWVKESIEWKSPRERFNAGWDAAMAAKAEPVQMIAKIKAARDWLDSEEAKVGTWWSPILRKQSIRTRFINKIDSALDAYLAAQPVTVAVEWEYGSDGRWRKRVAAGEWQEVTDGNA